MSEIILSRHRAVAGVSVGLMLGAVACSSSSSTPSATTTHPAAIPAAGLYAVDIGTGEATLFLERPDGSGFTLAPEADLIAFEDDDADDRPQIFVMNADGTGRRQVTHEPRGARSPAWSPDSARIAFLGLARDLTYQIYILDVGSGEANRITREPRDVEGAPAWSPSGKTVVFQLSEDSDTEPRLRSVDVATGTTTTIAEDAGLPDVSPDGSRLAFNTWSIARVTLADSDGSNRVIVRTDTDMYNAKWSPNGERIAFQSYPGDHVNVYEVSSAERRVAGSGDIVDWLDDQTLLVLV